MSALLALYSLCPSMPLERKLPEIYIDTWQKMGTQNARVHATSKFKSQKERDSHINTKAAARAKKQRQREQWEYERFADLNRVHMNDDLREYIQDVLRKQYMEIHEETKMNEDIEDQQKITKLFNSLQSFMDENSIKDKLKNVEEELSKRKDQKIDKFLSKLIKRLNGLGFKESDSRKGALLTAGVDFLENEDRVSEFVTNTDNEVLSGGTKVVKQYKTNDFKVNIEEYMGDAVTWLCLHLDEKNLPLKYAAKGKQFEVTVVNRDALDFKTKRDPFSTKVINDEDENLDGIPMEKYYWLIQFGFPKKITAQCIRDNANESKYVILGKLYRKLVEQIGNKEVKASLKLEDEKTKEEFDELLTV